MPEIIQSWSPTEDGTQGILFPELEPELGQPTWSKGVTTWNYFFHNPTNKWVPAWAGEVAIHTGKRIGRSGPTTIEIQPNSLDTETYLVLARNFEGTQEEIIHAIKLVHTTLSLAQGAEV